MNYRIVVAPSAALQIDSALLWWEQNRAAIGLLKLEIETAFRLIENVPLAGRAVKSRLFGNVRKLLLRKTGYNVYYQLIEAKRQVNIVHFRHARRRPL